MNDSRVVYANHAGDVLEKHAAVAELDHAPVAILNLGAEPPQILLRTHIPQYAVYSFLPGVWPQCRCPDPPAARDSACGLGLRTCAAATALLVGADSSQEARSYVRDRFRELGMGPPPPGLP